MIDPITAVATATAAFNTIKKGFAIGRDVETMAGDLGRWMGAVSDIKKAEELNKKPPLFKKLFAAGSVEEEALQIFMAKKKAQDMREELRNVIQAGVSYNQVESQIRSINLDLDRAEAAVNSGSAQSTPSVTQTSGSEGGGCLIATAAYGSEMAPQVQFLREIRDGKVMTTESGTTFMTGFNQFYYSFSPAVADYERENPIFKETVKVALTPMLTSLTLLNYVDVDTEEQMLGWGISLILLNIGMYFVAPAAAIVAIKRRFF